MTNDEEPGWTKINLRQPPDHLRQYGPCMEIGIRPAIDGAATITALALIDTGAHSTGISAEIAQRLGLSPVDHGTIHEAGREPIVAPVYRVRLTMASLDAELEVTGLPSLSKPHDAIIGRDILAGCRLAIDFASGRTTLHIRARS